MKISSAEPHPRYIRILRKYTPTGALLALLSSSCVQTSLESEWVEDADLGQEATDVEVAQTGSAVTFENGSFRPIDRTGPFFRSTALMLNRGMPIGTGVLIDDRIVAMRSNYATAAVFDKNTVIPILGEVQPNYYIRDGMRFFALAWAPGSPYRPVTILQTVPAFGDPMIVVSAMDGMVTHARSLAAVGDWPGCYSGLSFPDCEVRIYQSLQLPSDYGAPVFYPSGQLMGFTGYGYQSPGESSQVARVAYFNFPDFLNDMRNDIDSWFGPNPCPSVFGDANGDGRLDASDPAAVSSVASSGDGCAYASTDVNFDDQIDDDDAQLILAAVTTAGADSIPVVNLASVNTYVCQAGIQNAHHRRCLNQSTPSTNVAEACGTSHYDSLFLTELGGGLLFIDFQGNNQTCLRTENGGLTTGACSDTDNRSWWRRTIGSTGDAILRNMATNTCLHVDSTGGLSLANCRHNAHQRWRIVQTYCYTP